jgi:hypothetical protein
MAGRLVRRLRRRAFAAYTQQIGSTAARVQPPIAESVKTWCDGHAGYEYQTIRAPEITMRKLPKTIEPVVDDRFYKIAGAEYTVPEKYLARIPHARMIGDTGLIVLPDGAFGSETTFGPHHLIEQAAYATPLPAKARNKRGNYFSLISIWAHHPNYYHWVHDSLLRCHLILPLLPEDTRFIVPPKLRRFQLDSLALLGISPDRLCSFTGDQLWDLETLYFAPPNSSSASNVPATLKWFRELAWSKYALTPAASRRIYISRRNTQYRRIVNEEAVEAVFRDHGFTTYRFEELSFQEQVTLMSQAEVVASASGAALTNIMFAPPGAKVFVMVEPVQISLAFWMMAEAAGHEYWYAVGETVAGVPPPHDADFTVPPEKVARTLEAMLR